MSDATSDKPTDLWRSLRRRLLLFAGLSSVLVVGLILTLQLYLATQATQHHARTFVSDSVELQRPVCQQAPASFASVRPYGDIHAYDGETLRSLNPSAPPLRDKLREALNGGQTSASEFIAMKDDWGGAVAIRTSAVGPCAVMMARWSKAPGLRGGVVRRAILIVFVAVVIIIGLTLLLVIRPTLRRLRRLRQAAVTVGSDGAGGAYTSAGDTTPDELGIISQALDHTHARIMADASELAARQATLENYMADVGHDVKTALTTVQLRLESALANAVEDRQPLSGALADIVYIGALTDNLRTAARLEHGEEVTSKDVHADLYRIIARVAERMAVVGRQKGVEVNFAGPDEPVMVNIDATLAEQALTNVVHNAIRHRLSDGGHVAVALELDAQSFRVNVRDDGPGIAPEQLERLARRGVSESPAGARDRSGSGLGMAITREVCRRASWSLTYGLEQPHGLCVTIEGPLAKS